jgi:RNA polymerase sigma-70 factor (ECF subfamily)
MSQWIGTRIMASHNDFDSAAEQAIVERCRRQDYDAFSKVVDAYQARVMGYVRRFVRNEEEVLDVTQEVFIKAFQAMARFDGRASLRSWLFRIAHNLCIDRARKRDRTPLELSMEPIHEGDEGFEFADRRWDPAEMVLTEELGTVLEASLASMSDKLRTVLILHDQEDMGYEEIATTINVPVGTVKSRLFLARAHVQKSLSAYLGNRGSEGNPQAEVRS